MFCWFQFSQPERLFNTHTADSEASFTKIGQTGLCGKHKLDWPILPLGWIKSHVCKVTILTPADERHQIPKNRKTWLLIVERVIRRERVSGKSTAVRAWSVVFISPEKLSWACNRAELWWEKMMQLLGQPFWIWRVQITYLFSFSVYCSCPYRVRRLHAVCIQWDIVICHNALNFDPLVYTSVAAKFESKNKKFAICNACQHFACTSALSSLVDVMYRLLCRGLWVRITTKACLFEQSQMWLDAEWHPGTLASCIWLGCTKTFSGVQNSIYPQFIAN